MLQLTQLYEILFKGDIHTPEVWFAKDYALALSSLWLMAGGT